MLSFITLIRPETYTCRWSWLAWWTLARFSSLRMRTSLFFWVMKREDLLDEVGRGARKAPGRIWYALGRYVYVPCAMILCGVALIMKVAF